MALLGSQNGERQCGTDAVLRFWTGFLLLLLRGARVGLEVDGSIIIHATTGQPELAGTPEDSILRLFH